MKTDSTTLVVFSEEQTFQPLEMINSYSIDTTKKEGYYQLTKTYGLTQFDSGVYTIPKQKIRIGENIFFTDSLQVQVNPVIVDTTKQKLFDIKPLIEVDKKPSIFWRGLLGSFYSSYLELEGFYTGLYGEKTHVRSRENCSSKTL